MESVFGRKDGSRGLVVRYLRPMDTYYGYKVLLVSMGIEYFS